MSVDPLKYSTIVNVRNIPGDMTDEELKFIFSTYGTLTSYKIMRSGNIESGRFAYVAFEDPDAAEEAIIELNGQETSEGQRIYLRRTGEKIIRQKTLKKKPETSNVVASVKRCEIFVKNLEVSVVANDLRTLFCSCGTITEVKIIMENNRSKGYGFVGFTTPEAANKAVTEVNGRILNGKRIHVELATGTDHRKNTMGDFFSRLIERRGDNFGSRWDERRYDNFGRRWSEQRDDNFGRRWNERRENIFGRRWSERDDSLGRRWNERRENIFGRRENERRNDNIGTRWNEHRRLGTNPTASSSSDEAIGLSDDPNDVSSLDLMFSDC